MCDDCGCQGPKAPEEKKPEECPPKEKEGCQGDAPEKPCCGGSAEEE